MIFLPLDNRLLGKPILLGIILENSKTLNTEEIQHLSKLYGKNNLQI